MMVRLWVAQMCLGAALVCLAIGDWLAACAGRLRTGHHDDRDTRGIGA
jgi:hypothetical protein